MAVALLATCFIVFSLALLTNNLQWLPWQPIWENFADRVSLERQAEIGIAILGVTVSGVSAAALFLVRQGTDRWAMNRRVGNFLLFFAEGLQYRLHQSDFDYKEAASILRAFLQAALPLFEKISDHHGAAQTRFELARLEAHSYLENNKDDREKVAEIAVHLYCASLICRYSLVVSVRDDGISERVQEALARILSFHDLKAKHFADPRIEQSGEEG